MTNFYRLTLVLGLSFFYLFNLFGANDASIYQCNVEVTGQNDFITISGLSNLENTKVFDENYQIVWECAPWLNNTCGDNIIVGGLNLGATYFVSINSTTCNEWIPVELVDNTLPLCGIEYNVTDGVLAISGISDELKIRLFQVGISWECGTEGSTPCSETEIVEGLSGTYLLNIFSDNCVSDISLNISEGCSDADNDGVCTLEDCDDNNPNLPAPSGTFCDDGDPNTTNDIIQEDGCTCAGTVINGCEVNYVVSDNTLTISDIKPDQNIKLFRQGFLFKCGPDTDIPCSETEVITGLSAGLHTFTSFTNECDIFYNVTITGDCADADNDGFCDFADCDDNDVSIPATLGDSCDDGNPDTENDVIQEDGCTCAGTVINGCEVNYVVSDNTLTISDIKPNQNIKLFRQGFLFKCGPDTDIPCSETEVITGLSAGLHTFTSFTNECDIFYNVTITGDCADADNDGVCDFADCDDNDVSIPATLGDSCDDGNPDTENDVIQEDGCTCAGTVINGCEVNYVVSDNTLTISDIKPDQNIKLFRQGFLFKCGPDTDIPCSETEVITGLSAGLHTFTSFTNECDIFYNVTITGDCADADNDGFCDFADCDDNDVSIPATLGDFCDDGNPNTENDAIQADGCTCAGTPIATGCSISVSSSDNSLFITGLTDTENTKVFDAAYNIIWECNPWDSSCQESITINDLVAGSTYFVSVQSNSCDEWIPVIIEGEDSQPVGCDAVTLSEVNGKVVVNNLTSDIHIVKIYDENWNRVFECVTGADCTDFGPFQAGLYRFHIQQYTENWEFICETDFLSFETNGNQSSSRNGENTFYEKAITLFPNPAQTTLNLNTYELKNKRVSIEIFDVLGKQVTRIPEKIITSGFETIDVSHFENGLYLMTIKVDNRSMISKRFVKEHLK